VNMSLQNPEGDEPRKYVLMDFEEARKWTVTGGIGAEIAKIGGCATCLDAPAGDTGFSPRVSFGLTRRNFLGTGHIISFQSRASTLQKRGVLSYNAPQFRGDPDINLLFSGVYDDSRDVRTYSARRREASVQVGQRWSRASTMLYRITYRRVSISDLKISDPVLIPQFLQPVRLGIVAGTYIQDRRDDPTDSHRGVYNTLDVGWATRLLASQADFTRVLGHNATYHPMGLGSRYVLARSLTFGFLKRLGETHEIPLPERFFGGGPTSHRGFPSNQAGPRDLQTGFPLGGNTVLVNQFEMRYPLIGENIRGTLFLDSGNVYSDLKKLSLRVTQKGLDDFNYMVHAVGFGLRYRTPVGPIRIDLAYSINPPRFFGCHGTREQLLTGCPEKRQQQISHFQFHFSLGQAF
ncbi:MAG TPA: outer membrane protein assembly factor, partial [Bryobacteraceae bacterium]|nr:outer membrane protein assembly factor [Bryobacteraceae bacterium]